MQQSFDQNGIVRNYVKWDHRLEYQDNPGMMASRALQVAQSDPRGPVYMSVPREIALLPTLVSDHGLRRYVGTDLSLLEIGGHADYRFGTQAADSVGVTVRAAYTFTGVSTLPNCRRDMVYTRFLISPLGFSIGGRNGSFMTLVFDRDKLPLIHLCSRLPLLKFPRTSGRRL